MPRIKDIRVKFPGWIGSINVTSDLSILAHAAGMDKVRKIKIRATKNAIVRALVPNHWDQVERLVGSWWIVDDTNSQTPGSWYWRDNVEWTITNTAHVVIYRSSFSSVILRYHYHLAYFEDNSTSTSAFVPPTRSYWLINYRRENERFGTDISTAGFYPLVSQRSECKSYKGWEVKQEIVEQWKEEEIKKWRDGKINVGFGKILKNKERIKERKWKSRSIKRYNASWIGLMTVFAELKVLVHAAHMQHISSIKVPKPRGRPPLTLGIKYDFIINAVIRPLSRLDGLWFVVDDTLSPMRWHWRDYGTWKREVADHYIVYTSTKAPFGRRYHYHITYPGSLISDEQKPGSVKRSFWLVHYEWPNRPSTSNLEGIVRASFYAEALKQVHKYEIRKIESGVNLRDEEDEDQIPSLSQHPVTKKVKEQLKKSVLPSRGDPVEMDLLRMDEDDMTTSLPPLSIYDDSDFESFSFSESSDDMHSSLSPSIYSRSRDSYDYPSPSLGTRIEDETLLPEVAVMDEGDGFRQELMSSPEDTRSVLSCLTPTENENDLNTFLDLDRATTILQTQRSPSRTATIFSPVPESRYSKEGSLTATRIEVTSSIRRGQEEDLTRLENNNCTSSYADHPLIQDSLSSSSHIQPRPSPQYLESNPPASRWPSGQEDKQTFRSGHRDTRYSETVFSGGSRRRRDELLALGLEETHPSHKEAERSIHSDRLPSRYPDNESSTAIPRASKTLHKDEDEDDQQTFQSGRGSSKTTDTAFPLAPHEKRRRDDISTLGPRASQSLYESDRGSFREQKRKHMHIDNRISSYDASTRNSHINGLPLGRATNSNSPSLSFSTVSNKQYISPEPLVSTSLNETYRKRVQLGRRRSPRSRVNDVLSVENKPQDVTFGVTEDDIPLFAFGHFFPPIPHVSGNSSTTDIKDDPLRDENTINLVYYDFACRALLDGEIAQLEVDRPLQSPC